MAGWVPAHGRADGQGRLTVALVMATGSRAWFAWPPELGMAAIASTTSIPETTVPKIE